MGKVYAFQVATGACALALSSICAADSTTLQVQARVVPKVRVAGLRAPDGIRFRVTQRSRVQVEVRDRGGHLSLQVRATSAPGASKRDKTYVYSIPLDENGDPPGVIVASFDP
jgi:hypothetical protein